MMKLEDSAFRRQEGGDHYTRLKIQPLEYIYANNLGFCEGNVVKYVTRWKYKNGLQDLEKSLHYVDFLIEFYNTKSIEPSIYSEPLKITPVEYIYANGLGYCEGEVITHITQWNSVQDLMKVKHSINLLIEMETSRV